MSNRLTRRQFGGLVASGASLAVLASSAGLARAEERVRLIWWGNPERDKRTYAVVDLYQQMNADTSVDPETYSWGDYWTKLATQAAGQNLPDVIQMDYRYIFEYARRGQLEPLDGFIGGELELADFDQNQLDSGKVDDQVYGISMGANSMSHVYNQTVVDELGIDLPDPTAWTTEDFIALGNEVKDRLPDGMFFVSNMGGQENMLETWTRQRGKGLYTADGELAFDQQDLQDFWQFWMDLQVAGLTPPADVQALDTGKMDEMMLINRRTLFDFLHSNQLVAAQNLMEDEIGITMIPNQPGGQPGQYMKPSMLLSMAATSPDKSAAAELLNFFITSPEANDVLLIERGVTGDASIRDRISAGLTETERKIIDYLNVVGGHVSPLPPPPPKGAGEIDRAIEPAWQAIAFGQKSVEDGSADFYEFAKTTLERS
ncbi:ABC transporter substrate-binding protein [Bauldia sp.]|uniref:ABC transporter substrate-binding protein n=1 Tax=Bauldia sp. TaxID=2575872 RepID=UPI003BAC6E62